jgi:hypothetical protein
VLVTTGCSASLLGLRFAVLAAAIALTTFQPCRAQSCASSTPPQRSDGAIQQPAPGV